jgi:hypothetical protein
LKIAGELHPAAVALGMSMEVRSPFQYFSRLRELLCDGYSEF